MNKNNNNLVSVMQTACEANEERKLSDIEDAKIVFGWKFASRPPPHNVAAHNASTNLHLPANSASYRIPSRVLDAQRLYETARSAQRWWERERER